MMMKFHKLTALTALIIFSTLNTDAAVTGWTNWRGPHQSGRSDATDLPKAIRPADALWTHDIAGRGHAVIADGRVFAWGYRGKGADLQEVLLCLDEANGKTIWEHGYNDYLSDTVYSRYTVGAPTIDRRPVGFI